MLRQGKSDEHMTLFFSIKSFVSPPIVLPLSAINEWRGLLILHLLIFTRLLLKCPSFGPGDLLPSSKIVMSAADDSTDLIKLQLSS